MFYTSDLHIEGRKGQESLYISITVNKDISPENTYLSWDLQKSPCKKTDIFSVNIYNWLYKIWKEIPNLGDASHGAIIKADRNHFLFNIVAMNEKSIRHTQKLLVNAIRDEFFPGEKAKRVKHETLQKLVEKFQNP